MPVQSYKVKSIEGDCELNNAKKVVFIIFTSNKCPFVMWEDRYKPIAMNV